MSSREYGVAYYSRNAEKIRARAAKYYMENRERVCARQRERRAQSSDEFNRATRFALLTWKKRVFDRLGSTCKRCGESDYRVLQLDHIHGNGTSARKNEKSKSSLCFYRMLALSEDLEDNIQVLCANCNWRKRYEDNEVLHYPSEMEEFFGVKA